MKMLLILVFGLAGGCAHAPVGAAGTAPAPGEWEATTRLTREVVSTSEILIREPVARVFEAFVDPAVTTRFWFDEGTAPLENGETVQWRFGSVWADVQVRVLEKNERILVELGTRADDTTTVEWVFIPQSEGTTRVRITHEGFRGDGDEIVAAALDSKGGFSLVLAAAKAYLEHGVRLNIVADK